MKTTGGRTWSFSPQNVFPAVLCVGLVFGAFGCASIPFERVAKVSVSGWSPERVRADYARNLPSSYQSVNSVVFCYYWKKFAALGWLAVDREKESFALSVMTPLGVKLFDLTGVGNAVECPYVMEEFKKRGDFASRVGGDVRQMLLQLTPADDAVVSTKKYAMTFTEGHDGRETEYVFAGTDMLLVEKSCREQGRKVWTIGFYDYFQQDDKWFPRGMTFRHHRHRYGLDVRHKSFIDSGTP